MLKFATPNNKSIWINPAIVRTVQEAEGGGTWIDFVGGTGTHLVEAPAAVAELITHALSDNPIERRAAINSTRQPAPAKEPA